MKCRALRGLMAAPRILVLLLIGTSFVEVPFAQEAPPQQVGSRSILTPISVIYDDGIDANPVTYGHAADIYLYHRAWQVLQWLGGHASL